MQGSALRQARKQRGWTQTVAARRLGVSQGYLSLLENGRRPVTPRLLRKLQRQVDVPPTELRVAARSTTVTAPQLAEELAALGYPGFAYVRARPRLNPAHVVLTALRAPNLEARLAEALPWVLLRYPDLDWDWLLREAKVLDLQNRLGFVVTLARTLADRGGDTATARRLGQREHQLERSRLVREDTFCRDSMTEAERRWLRTKRSAEAAHWNLLTALAPNHLAYAA